MTHGQGQPEIFLQGLNPAGPSAHQDEQQLLASSSGQLLLEGAISSQLDPGAGGRECCPTAMHHLATLGMEDSMSEHQAKVLAECTLLTAPVWAPPGAGTRLALLMDALPTE